MVGRPFIPKTITVHLGAPDSNAENVTVSFADYIKNVASSEIYPTWPENAIRANIYAQISYALNRVYTEWYRSRGYDFDITNSTAYDQSFVNGRDIFENISRITDELFNDYIRRQGNIEPLFASFCDGREVTCNGLSQWGSVELANQGLGPYDILTRYYGNDIELVQNAPIQEISESYGGTPLRLGSSGQTVRTIQTQLNRISRDYPLIPKITSIDGVFGKETEDAVKQFQKIFNLSADGIIGKATWYKIKSIFVAVSKLGALNSEGIKLADVSKNFVTELKKGDSGDPVRVVQYYLAVISVYNNAVPSLNIDGIFGNATESSVKSFQRFAGLEETGIVDKTTWDALSDSYLGILASYPPQFIAEDYAPYPGSPLVSGSSGEAVRVLQSRLDFISGVYKNIPQVAVTGIFDQQTAEAADAFAEDVGVPPKGFVGPSLWKLIEDTYFNLKNGDLKTPGQYPGYAVGG